MAGQQTASQRHEARRNEKNNNHPPSFLIDRPAAHSTIPHSGSHKLADAGANTAMSVFLLSRPFHWIDKPASDPCPAQTQSRLGDGM
jgi:hypothetical protein